MKNIYSLNLRLSFVLFLFLNSTLLFSQTPQWQWVKGGGTVFDCNLNNNDESCKSLGVDGNGNIYGISALGSWGYTQIDTCAFNSFGWDDFVVFSYKCDGTFRWARHFGSSVDDSPGGLTVDKAGNVYVVGSVIVSNASDAHFGDSIVPATSMKKVSFFAKLDSNGHTIVLNLPGPNIVTGWNYGQFLGIEADSQGNLCVLTKFWSSMIWNGYTIPDVGYYIVKFDKNYGNLMSLKKIDINGNFHSLEFSTSKNTNYYFVGHILDTAQVGTHIITSNSFSHIDTTFVACLDSNGTYLWHRQIGGTWMPFGFMLKPIADSLGVYVVASGKAIGTNFLGQYLNNPLDTNHAMPIVAKLNAFNGNLNWAIRMKITNFTLLGRLFLTNNSTLVGSGEYVQYVILNNNDTVKPYAPMNRAGLFVYNLDCQTGYANWGIGTTSSGTGNDAYTTFIHNNNIYVGGMISDSLYDNFGHGIHSQGGSSDFFIAKIAVDNNCSCIKALPNAQVVSMVYKTLTVKGNATGTLDSLYWFWGDGTKTKYLTQNSNVSHTYQNSGSYSVCLRTYNYCGTQDSCTQVVITAINETELKEIITYPNPVNNNLTIENPYYKDLKVTILNAIGIQLYQKQYENQTITIDMRKYAPGVYFVEIQTMDRIKTVKKVVKE